MSKLVNYKDIVEWHNEKGCLHRTDGDKEWYLNGKDYPKEQ